MGGMFSPAWYDIVSMGGGKRWEDEQGLLQSRQQGILETTRTSIVILLGSLPPSHAFLFLKVMQFVREEVDQHGIHANRIVIGGFSQGCALGLLSGLTSEYKLAGILALSGYVPIHTKIMTMATDANRKTPIFWAHGDADQVNKRIDAHFFSSHNGAKLTLTTMFQRWSSTNLANSRSTFYASTSILSSSILILEWVIVHP